MNTVLMGAGGNRGLGTQDSRTRDDRNIQGTYLSFIYYNFSAYGMFGKF